MRRTARSLGRILGYSALGYAGYISCVHLAVRKEIQDRSQIVDLKQKYAPIKIMGRYINPFNEYRHQTLFEFAFRRVSELFSGDLHAHHLTREALIKSLPQLQPNFHRAKAHQLVLTWIGQSCSVVQLPGDVTFLTDPMFAEYVVSPKIGPQRLTPAPCKALDIPQPQAVLVSHDHQDHLDIDAAKALVKDGTTFVVPLGVKKHFPKGSSIIEMKWWDKIPFPNTDPKLKYEIACTPAMHWSGRRLYDSNTTLWCSFMILKNGKPLVFHGGDTGYSKPMFQAIKNVYGPFCRVALLPCGSYHPQWHLRAQHMSPLDCVNASRDLEAKKTVGVHWGTFMMSEEPVDEPPKLLSEISSKMEAEEERNAILSEQNRSWFGNLFLSRRKLARPSIEYRTINHGETVEIDIS